MTKNYYKYYFWSVVIFMTAIFLTLTTIIPQSWAYDITKEKSFKKMIEALKDGYAGTAESAKKTARSVCVTACLRETDPKCAKKCKKVVGNAWKKGFKKNIPSRNVRNKRPKKEEKECPEGYKIKKDGNCYILHKDGSWYIEGKKLTDMRTVFFCAEKTDGNAGFVMNVKSYECKPGARTMPGMPFTELSDNDKKMWREGNPPPDPNNPKNEPEKVAKNLVPTSDKGNNKKEGAAPLGYKKTNNEAAPLGYKKTNKVNGKGKGKVNGRVNGKGKVNGRVNGKGKDDDDSMLLTIMLASWGVLAFVFGFPTLLALVVLWQFFRINNLEKALQQCATRGDVIKMIPPTVEIKEVESQILQIEGGIAEIEKKLTPIVNHIRDKTKLIKDAEKNQTKGVNITALQRELKRYSKSNEITIKDLRGQIKNQEKELLPLQEKYQKLLSEMGKIIATPSKELEKLLKLKSKKSS